MTLVLIFSSCLQESKHNIVQKLLKNGSCYICPRILSLCLCVLIQWHQQCASMMNVLFSLSVPFFFNFSLTAAEEPGSYIKRSAFCWRFEPTCPWARQGAHVSLLAVLLHCSAVADPDLWPWNDFIPEIRDVVGPVALTMTTSITK